MIRREVTQSFQGMALSRLVARACAGLDNTKPTFGSESLTQPEHRFYW